MIRSREVADKAHGWFRTWFAKVWHVRGGGLYSVGFASTFIFFEIRTIVSEFAESSGIAFLVFTTYLKQPIERWLSPEDDQP